MNETLPFCCDITHNRVRFVDFHMQLIFGYSSIVLCIIAIITNILNIIVFCKKYMVCPINIILAGVAATDLIISVAFIPYLYKAHIEPQGFSTTKCLSLGWIGYFMFFFYIFVWIHRTTVWLTVFASIWRYIAITYPLQSQTWCSTSRTYKAVVIILLICLLPTLIVPQVIKVEKKRFSLDGNGYLSQLPLDSNVTVYTYVEHDAFIGDDAVKTELLLWILALRVIPTIVLIYISIKLSYTLVQTKKLRRRLTLSTTIRKDSGYQASRTTGMLLGLSLLLLITEIPEGFVELMQIIHRNLMDECAPQLPEFYQILTLINSIMTFPIYYVMSTKYRTALNSLFRNRDQESTRFRCVSSNGGPAQEK